MYINQLLSRYSILMSTKMLRIMVRQAMQLLTPTKLVVEMMRIPVVTPIAMDVLCVCMSLMINSMLKQQEKPRKSKTRYCQGFSGETSMKGQSHADVVRRKRLIWLQMTQGLLVGNPRNKDATIPKMMLGANLNAYAGLVHSMVIDPPTIAPKMMRQKHPCLPAKVSHMMAKIIPPDAFQPNQRQKQAPIDVKMAMILSRSSCGFVGKKGMSRFFLMMKIKLQMKVTSMVKKRSWTDCIFSCQAIDKLMQSKTGPSSSSETGEKSISGQSANYLYQYSCLSNNSYFFCWSFSSIIFLACAIFLSIPLSNRAKMVFLVLSSLVLGLAT